MQIINELASYVTNRNFRIQKVLIMIKSRIYTTIRYFTVATKRQNVDISFVYYDFLDKSKLPKNKMFLI